MGEFRVVSEYNPSGDQPEAIDALSQGVEAGLDEQTLLGVTGSGKTYTMLTKLKSTYADGLLKVISPDGRIHTSFQMTVTATGRLSSTEPNLQNIPVRKELGSEIRKMFVAPPGKVLVDADYSQIELRLLAHISGDAAMKSPFPELINSSRKK